MVNQTKGSYVVIDSRNDLLWITFYTSGLFDLYGIRDDGPLKFCGDAGGLRMIGLGRSEAFKILDRKLVLDNGGPRKTFEVGPVPDLLMRLHHLNERAIASEL